MIQGLTSIPGFKYTIGLAYIALPTDIERAAYLKDCYMNSQVSILTEDGAFHNRVPISPEVLSFLVFPDTPKLFGSPVIYATEEQYSQPIIVARLQQREELGDGQENQFKFRRKLGDQLVEINASAKDGTINLMVDGAGVVGQINLNVFNKNQDCQLNVDVAGDINVVASGSTTISQQEQFEATTTDKDSGDFSSIKQTSTENKLYNQKLLINDGKDPLGLGNEIKQLFSDLIDAVSNITVATAIGTQPILNKVTVLKLKDQLNGLLSQVAFIDK